ncbi:LysR family transcriptional regulator [Pseudomonas promysalinigenes]
MMDSSTLEIFKAVASELSITRAATQLGRVQSNVTTRIQQLEAELETELFHREAKKLKLTEQGKLFLEYANRLLALAGEAKQAMHPEKPQGVLRVGAMESTAASRLPDPLAAFHKMHPDVTMLIETEPSQKLINLLIDGLIDCALLAVPHTNLSPEEYFKEHKLEAERAFEERLKLVLPLGYEVDDIFEKDSNLSLAAFQYGCSYRNAVTEWIASKRPWSDRPIAVNEVGSYHLMLACVAAGQSYSVIPDSVLKITGNTHYVKTATDFSSTTWLVWRAGFSVPSFNSFKALLKSTYSENLK